MSDNDASEKNGRTGFRKFAKKILHDDEGNAPIDPKEMLSSILQLSDKARTETVRLVAKEFRGYLDALEIKDDLHDFMTSYSVEVKASFRLKPVNNRRKRSTTHVNKDEDSESGDEQ